MKRISSFIVFLFMTTLVFGSPKVDLLTVFKQALENDPLYQKEHYQYLSIQQIHSQAIANLLPSAQANGEINYTKSFLPASNPFANFAASGRGKAYSLELSQPVFNFARWKELSKASDIVKQAEATYNAAYQQLIIRTTQAYFSVLEAQDNVSYTHAEKVAYKRQLDQAQQRFKVGLSAITAVYEAQAAYDAVIAREIAARNVLDNQREELRTITGQWYEQVKGLKQNIKLNSPNPNQVEKWVQTALRQNYDLLVAKFATQIAHHTLNIQRSGHLPTVTAIGNYAKADSQKVGTTNDSVSVKVALQLPIIQGGMVISRTRQSAHDYQATLSTLESVQRKITSQTRQSFNSVKSGISQIQADRQAVKSTKSSADSTQAAFEVGTRTIVDVLDAKKEMFRTQRALSSDLYSFLKDSLRLKQMAGTLSEKDLAEINQWLA